MKKTITTRRITKREKTETFIVLTTLALILCWLLTK